MHVSSCFFKKKLLKKSNLSGEDNWTRPKIFTKRCVNIRLQIHSGICQSVQWKVLQVLDCELTGFSQFRQQVCFRRYARGCKIFLLLTLRLNYSPLEEKKRYDEYCKQTRPDIFDHQHLYMALTNTSRYLVELNLLFEMRVLMLSDQWRNLHILGCLLTVFSWQKYTRQFENAL